MRITLAAILFSLASGGSSTEPDTFVENLDISVCDPSKGPFTLDIERGWREVSVGAGIALLQEERR